MVVHWQNGHQIKITSDGPTDFIIAVAGRQALAQRLRAWKAMYWTTGTS
jgi:hypothetical protein